jgi:hypothetical protein
MLEGDKHECILNVISKTLVEDNHFIGLVVGEEMLLIFLK